MNYLVKEMNINRERTQVALWVLAFLLAYCVMLTCRVWALDVEHSAPLTAEHDVQVLGEKLFALEALLVAQGDACRQHYKNTERPVVLCMKKWKGLDGSKGPHVDLHAGLPKFVEGAPIRSEDFNRIVDVVDATRQAVCGP